MKKPALFVIGLLLLAFIGIYFIIPQYITINAKVKIDATDVRVAKFMTNENRWAEWWPGDKPKLQQKQLTYNGHNYLLQNGTFGGMELALLFDTARINSYISIAATGDGESEVIWAVKHQSSINPFKRIKEFTEIKSRQPELDTILARFKKFMHQNNKVYGIDVSLEKIKISVMIAGNTVTTGYPSAQAIYKLADELQKQATAQGAKVTGQPLLNADQSGPDSYRVMVALPINKVIKPGAGQVINKMVLGGNLLTASVYGGPKTIYNAFRQLRNYQKDHGLISPAMPYEELQTNRLTQPDSGKWVTKICSPIY
ncbi:GyrI-like domain-containing protein [Mucilaginibacter pallidiroseus]|uniref:GyrI-like domain-containing protein n=1 Tax=Mucilaginibacter pallidiroseus TaxID=2599295 RepID=A0A563UDN0_9SPHI|nr:GyrI-like domain-containing protein [Mucilaginibacter pallidiroseus]TWR29440.1 GyrI-like domain-containing protein [Mucilaginibacter pallidiroseus]